ncbi:amino acid ABC transporter ATP-binding protein [Acetivibrio sp. MSJd-27]|uniref:amino acid ABC transporter ATP-binding protein n=1 Tax=Acetivibrio sp. MSJd-27 TaxID=2841523 RepID=UPI001C114DA7|nr:amino acid ABC transporter ATP-binding protein [Acetivibrio sp. MSJd-27]MBU5451353.1 amino acid ABC transporter ATP-binding protein [Acetivibrio sp. MSJd-27]
MIKAENIYKSFGKLSVLNGISIEVRPGEVIAIIGRSGSGKSTFLRCLNHLETVDKGTISIDGETFVSNGKYLGDNDIRRICMKTGMVFQSFNLFPHMTILKNVTEPQETVNKIPHEEAVKTARELLKKVGLSEKENAYPSQLSGGQKQRVAIARALAMKPEVMLFDEPTSALDPELTGGVLSTMKDLAKEHLTMIVVTHEMGFAREVADRVIFLSDGKICEQGKPAELFENPQTEELKTFLSSLLK